MYTIRVESTFSSAHNLRHYKGKCEELHGHNWKVEIALASDSLDKCGMVMDFTELKAGLREELERLDHKYLNTIPYFEKVNPTSEHIAGYLYGIFKTKFPSLKSVTVWENATSSATYEE